MEVSIMEKKLRKILFTICLWVATGTGMLLLATYHVEGSGWAVLLKIAGLFVSCLVATLLLDMPWIIMPYIRAIQILFEANTYRAGSRNRRKQEAYKLKLKYGSNFDLFLNSVVAYFNVTSDRPKHEFLYDDEY